MICPCRKVDIIISPTLSLSSTFNVHYSSAITLAIPHDILLSFLSRFVTQRRRKAEEELWLSIMASIKVEFHPQSTLFILIPIGPFAHTPMTIEFGNELFIHSNLSSVATTKTASLFPPPLPSPIAFFSPNSNFFSFFFHQLLVSFIMNV